MIEGVKQQKWWGWGEEGKGYSHHDRPKFAPFVKRLVGIDVNQPPKSPPPFESLDVPTSQLADDLRGQLEGIIGKKFVQTDDLTRVVHAFGKGVRDLVRVRRGDPKA